MLVYGAGAVGTLLGGRLAAAGLPVTLLGREPLRRAVAADGLHLLLPEGERRVDLPVATSLGALDHAPTLVLLTVKAYDVAATRPELEALAGAGATVVALQNGVGSEEELAVLPRLIAASFTLSVAAPAPGEVCQETAKGGLALAPIRGAADLTRLAGALRAAGLPTVQLADYRRMKWSKLLLNLLGNAGAALLARPPRALMADPRLFGLERRAFLEALAVMRALGLAPCALPGYDVPLLARAMRLPAPLARRLLAERVARGRGAKLPSLLRELERGRTRSEIDWLNGAVARHGAALGLPTPTNAALTTLFHDAACDPALRRHLAGNPARLLARIDELSTQPA
ncbi:MAG TPA: 2-dehydropantoate 2-reductase [Thermomicrobiaceae bacterium]|nr:2-dehydropantoate 2-reductase [Thermomicrobiaceae bacterium]